MFLGEALAAPGAAETLQTVPVLAKLLRFDLAGSACHGLIIQQALAVFNTEESPRYFSV